MKVCSTQVSSQSNLDNKTSSIILTSERSLKPNLSRLLKTGTEQNPLALAMGSVREKNMDAVYNPFKNKEFKSRHDVNVSVLSDLAFSISLVFFTASIVFLFLHFSQ